MEHVWPILSLNRGREVNSWSTLGILRGRVRAFSEQFWPVLGVLESGEPLQSIFDLFFSLIWWLGGHFQSIFCLLWGRKGFVRAFLAYLATIVPFRSIFGLLIGREGLLGALLAFSGVERAFSERFLPIFGLLNITETTRCGTRGSVLVSLP